MAASEVVSLFFPISPFILSRILPQCQQTKTHSRHTLQPQLRFCGATEAGQVNWLQFPPQPPHSRTARQPPVNGILLNVFLICLLSPCTGVHKMIALGSLMNGIKACKVSCITYEYMGKIIYKHKFIYRKLYIPCP